MVDSTSTIPRDSRVYRCAPLKRGALWSRDDLGRHDCQRSLDRKWVLAGAWAMTGAAFAVFGIIHVPEAGVENFSDPTWDQCE
jgi:hypothetical protein